MFNFFNKEERNKKKVEKHICKYLEEIGERFGQEELGDLGSQDVEDLLIRKIELCEKEFNQSFDILKRAVRETIRNNPLE
ncbi:hypothetical protein ACQFX9_14285 [Aliinostoc sp. HNIBRCY26]|uniref:hypothetical protein n=1 Tax=Aliinostoc sp. HNIBRCY26 TaxID=3418997 RepID=UPI003D08FE83